MGVLGGVFGGGEDGEDDWEDDEKRELVVVRRSVSLIRCDEDSSSS